MAATVEIRVPDLGDFADVSVIDVLVKEGDAIEVDTPLITLETEKSTMDVPSTAAGRVASVQVKKGSKVSKGSLILTLEPAAAAAPAQSPSSVAGGDRAEGSTPSKQAESEPTVRRPALQTTPAAIAPSPPSPRPPTDTQPIPQAKPAAASPPDTGRTFTPATGTSTDSKLAHASPSVRKFARELGVDLGRVQGSGPKGRITHDDVKAFVKKAMTQKATGTGAEAGVAWPKIPEVDFSKFGPTEVRPLTRIQRITGQRLHASWVNIPHVTQFDEADITELEETRTKLKAKAIKEGIKLTPLAFVIKACVKALQEFPQFNASLDPTGKELILKKYMHIGFAADTPNGLVVPVINDADKKDIYELARDLGTLSEKARAGKLSIAEMQGGCFTISSLGGIGGTAFTPIVNPPEVAILGVSRSDHKPVYKNGGFVPRLILPFSLSYDHRVIDGAAGVQFTTFVAQKLADVRGLLEAIP